MPTSLQSKKSAPRTAQARIERELTSALQRQDFASATRTLRAHPDLQPSTDTQRGSIISSSLGSVLYGRRDYQAGLDWCQAQGIAFPKDGDGWRQVTAILLEYAPTPVLDFWLAQTGPRQLEASLLAYALSSANTDALYWWLDRGHSCDETGHGKPWLLYTLRTHKLNAGPYLDRLMDHGVQPAPWLNPENLQQVMDTPLVFLARIYAEAEKNDTSQLQMITESERDQFRHLWKRLVQAGEQPALRTALGEQSLEILKKTPSWGWWQTEQRAEQLDAMLPKSPGARRLRG